MTNSFYKADNASIAKNIVSNEICQFFIKCVYFNASASLQNYRNRLLYLQVLTPHSYIKLNAWIIQIKYGYSLCQIRKDFPCTCNKCSHTETASVKTLFHKAKFGIRKAFFIFFEVSTTTKSLSASHVGIRFGVTEKTAR